MLTNTVAACLALALQPFTPHEAMLWQGINDARLERGLAAFQYSQTLSIEARRWVCEYPHRVESIVGAGNSVFQYRGAQHAPESFYSRPMDDENAWMYAPSVSAVLYGWRDVAGWLDSESHRPVLLDNDHECAGIAVQFGRFDTPLITPPQTGPVAAVFLLGECDGF